MINKHKILYRGLGRRKTSIAQVILIPGTGNITINNRLIFNFFPYKTLINDLEQPLNILGIKSNFDIIVKVIGGGFSGQSGAIKLGIARALVTLSNDYRIILRNLGMLTRDSRIKERKKYGLHGARRAPQYSKR